MPRSSLVEGPDGSLYGTTKSGGTKDAGTVFKLRKDGSGYTVLHGFSGDLGWKPDPKGMLLSGDMNGAPARFSGEGDGMEPIGLVFGSDGALYGMTSSHGKSGGGTAFRLNPDGSGFIVLHNFPDSEGDGKHPSGSLVKGSDGALYGTTKICNTTSFATLFRLSFPVSHPTLSTSPK